MTEPSAENALGIALTERFMKGVREGQWRVIALGDGRSLRLSDVTIDELGITAKQDVILLIATTPTEKL